jgi:CheY-like chemotaxis protein/HPt (histidine-containing phosphotransfer) domain-containing protein
MLDDLGARVRLAANGREALDALARESFDLVLMDCQMPEMDGFEALHRLRDPALTPQLPAAARTVPVVALTANALAGDDERCRAAGFDAYLPKPVKQGQLAQVVQQHCGTNSTARPAAAPAPDRVADAGEAAEAAATAGIDTEADTGADTAAVLDAAVIERIVDMERRGAPNLLARLVATYLDSAAKLVAAAERALAEHDGPALRQAVHTLKSSSANLAATDFAARCAELEALARDGAVAQARVQWPAARVEYDRAVRALRALGAQAAPHDLPGTALRSTTNPLSLSPSHGAAPV